MALLDFRTHPIGKRALLTLLLTAVFLIISIPFHVMEIIPGFTDIRPVMMLGPLYGVFFGIPGCLACGIGNLITDALSDSIRWSSIGGFISNFVGPLLFWLVCAKMSREPFRLRTGRDYLRHILLIVISAVLEAMIITPMVYAFYPDVDYMLFFLTVTMNGTVFPIVIGIPIIILMQEELGFKPLFNPFPRITQKQSAA